MNWFLKTTICYSLFVSTSALATEPQFNIAMIPKDPSKQGQVEALMKVSIFQKAGPQERLVRKFDTYIGDCQECSRGIALNCKFDTSQDASESAKACVDILKHGVGFRANSQSGKLHIDVKNGTGMPLTRQPAAETTAIKDNSPVQFVLKSDGDSSIRVEMTVWTQTEEQEPGQVKVFKTAIPEDLAGTCRERAEAIIKSIATADQTVPRLGAGQFEVKATFASAATWLAAPHDGIARYFATIRTSNNWDCDYDIHMAYTTGSHGVSPTCGLSQVHFRMCAQ